MTRRWSFGTRSVGGTPADTNTKGEEMKKPQFLEDYNVFDDVQKMVKCCGILRGSLGHVDLLEECIRLLIAERLQAGDKKTNFRIWNNIKSDVEQYLVECYGENFSCVVTFDESQSVDERNATIESVVDELQLISDMGRNIEIRRTCSSVIFEDCFVDELSEKAFKNAIKNALNGKQCKVEFFDHGI